MTSHFCLTLFLFLNNQTRKDGCICEFIYDRGVEDVLKSLIFAGVKNVPEINMAESFVEYLSTVDMVSSKYVTGFIAADFLLWDLTNDSEVHHYLEFMCVCYVA